MIGEKIKKFRVEKGFTLSELEKESGVSYVQISRYEKNKAKPTSKVIKKLAEALNVDISKLISEGPKKIEDQELYNQFDELMLFLKRNEEEKFVLSRLFETMLFKERTKSNLVNDH